MRDTQVGQILAVEKHPDADKLYVSSVDLGDPNNPRQILSGLRDHMSIPDLLHSRVLVVTNLKPAKMRGLESNGMLLCATDYDPTSEENVVPVVRCVRPPEDASVGTRLVLQDPCELETEALQAQLNKPIPPPQINPKKKTNIWKVVAEKLTTDQEGYACYDGRRLITAEGSCQPTDVLNGRVT